jgi:hypothetical protein
MWPDLTESTSYESVKVYTQVSPELAYVKFAIELTFYQLFHGMYETTPIS